MIRKIYFVFFLSVFAFTAVGQEGSDSTGVGIVSSSDEEEAAPPPPPPGISAAEEPEFIFKPTIGVGVGIMNYMGDLSKRTATNNPILNRIGWDLRVTQPMNDYLDFNFYMTIGKIGANERSLERNLNFESRITTAGLAVSYNFDHFLPEERTLEPYISIGVEAMEFLSKTDLIDQFGNPYHYWADGSIRNLPETPENEAVAVRIQRDYVYESDIRALNLDGFGDYDERTIGLPIGVGANMHLGGKVKFRVGTTLHYTFSDLLDGVSDQSVGVRKGNSGNDMFLFSSFSLNYNLTGDNEIPDFKPGEFENLELADDDGDEVMNVADECPNTPSHVEVDAKGCPLDEDGDGVADYLDQEPGTPTGAPVDSSGIALSEEALELIYLEYKDESGQYSRFDESYAITSPEETGRPTKKYFVVIGDTKQALSPTDAARYLNDPNITTIQNDDGSVSFVSKEGYDSKIDAAIAAGEISDGNGNRPNKVAESTPIGPNQGVKITRIKQRFPNATTNRPKDERSVEYVQKDPKDKTLFRIQVGAFTRVLSKDIFEDVPELFVITTDDGLTRYYSGTFDNFQDAANAKIDLVSQGFDGAYVVSFKGGQKISLLEAGATPVPDYTPPTTPKSSVDPSKVKFRVQIGSYSAQVPVDVIDRYASLGQVDQRNGSDGQTKFVAGSFSTYAEAAKFKQDLLDQGFDAAFVVGEYNNNIIPAKEAIELVK